MNRMAILVVLAMGLSGCATTDNQVLEGPIPDVVNGSATHTYRYQFNLVDYITDYTVQANAPYSINIPDVALSYNDKNMIYGVSDDDGFTAPIFLEHPIDIKTVRVLHRYGEGKLGEVFLVKDQGNNPISDYRYLIAVSCPGGDEYTLQGRTDRNGYSVFVATEEPCRLCMSSGTANVFEVTDPTHALRPCSAKSEDTQ